MRTRFVASLAGVVIFVVCSSVAPCAAGTAAGGKAALSPRASKAVRQRLYMCPRCFVAGKRASADVILTHAGPHARVEFIWAPKKGVLLGPGYGPGIFSSNGAGVVHFTAVVPSHYGSGTIGTWVLAAEWPRAAHAFVRVEFHIVAKAAQC